MEIFPEGIKVAQMKICRYCGAQLEDQAQFCMYCGRTQGPEGPQNYENQWNGNSGGYYQNGNGGSYNPYGQGNGGPYNPYGQGNGQPPYYGPQQKNNGLAIAALVVGLVGLFWNPVFIMGILAVVFGLVGKAQISSNPMQKGGGMAIAGLVLGIVDIVGTIMASMMLQSLTWYM